MVHGDSEGAHQHHSPRPAKAGVDFRTINEREIRLHGAGPLGRCQGSRQSRGSTVGTLRTNKSKRSILTFKGKCIVARTFMMNLNNDNFHIFTLTPSLSVDLKMAKITAEGSFKYLTDKKVLI